MKLSGRSFTEWAALLATLGIWTLGGPVLLAQESQVTVSGKVKGAQGSGVPNVTLLASSGQSAHTDAQGKYTLKFPRGWTGVITPQGQGVAFSPPSRSYSNLLKNATQNFSGKAPVSGCVLNSAGGGVSGIKISLNRGGGSQTTNSQGCFSIMVPLRYVGIITPSQKTVTVSPQTRYVEPVYAPDSGNDFSVPDLTISGTLVDEKNQPLTTACVWFSAYGTQKEPLRLFPDSLGQYSRSIPYGWQGTVTPSRSGLTFTPPVRNYPDYRVSVSSQNFRGSPPQGSVTLSLKVVDSHGRPVPGATAVVHDTDGKVALVRQTSSDGRADFGTIDHLFATLTVGREVPLPDGSFSRAIDTLTNAPLSAETMVFSSITAIENPPPHSSTVTVHLPTAYPAAVEPFSVPWRPESPTLFVLPWHIQSDGKLSLIGVEGNVGEGNDRWWRYGFLLDQAWISGAAYEIPFLHEPRIVPYTSNQIALNLLSVFGQRKNVWFLLGRRSFQRPAPLSGTLRVADRFPAEEYLVSVSGTEWQDGGRLVEWYSDQGFRTLPPSFQVTLPALNLRTFDAQARPPAAQWSFWSTPWVDLITLTFNFRGQAEQPGKGSLTKTRWSISLDPIDFLGWSQGKIQLPEPLSDWIQGATAENAHLMSVETPAALNYEQALKKILASPAAFELLEQSRTLNWIFFSGSQGSLLSPTPLPDLQKPSPPPPGPSLAPSSAGDADD